MKALNKFESKRFTLVIFAFIVLSTMGIWSIPSKMEAVGVAVAGALAAVIMWYVKKESDRPSIKKEDNSIQETPEGHSDK